MSPTRRHAVRIIPRPILPPLRSGIHRIETVYNVVVDLDVDGATGTGFCFAFHEREAVALRALTEMLLEELDGYHDWSQVRRIWTDLWAMLNHIGQSGPPVVALAAVDTALWDLLGHQLGTPLHVMWGSGRDRVPTYASGGWLSYSTDELLAEAERFVAAGFTRYKMKIGSRDHDADIARVREVSDALRGRAELMVDANQAYSRPAALRMGRRLQDLGVDWFEEPVDAADFEGSAALAAALDMRIAAGETVFGVEGMRTMIAAGAADVLMPDLMRCGGLTPLRDVPVLGAVARLDVAPHLFPEICAHVAASSPGDVLLEYLPRWWEGFYARAPKLDGGSFVLDDTPGLGIEIAADLPVL